MPWLFRDYDQAELDRQLNARGTVPDIAPFIAAYAQESARMRATLRCEIGLRYGPSEAERLDVFMPESAGPHPVFVFFHGGYWRLLDSADSGFMAETFTRAGAVVVAVNYALAPGATLEEITRQCRSALAWVHLNIKGFGGEPSRIHISGSSAGGHLVGMMLPPGWHAGFGVPETIIHSASPLSGLYDLEPVRLSHVNGWLNLDAGRAAALSPLRHLPANPPPCIIGYAPSETAEFKRQSEVYAAALAARGGEVEILIEPDTNHFDIPLKLMDRNSHLTRSIFRLMGL